MLGSAAFAGGFGGSNPVEDPNATLLHSLNAAAVEGDEERVRELLAQFLDRRAQRTHEPLRAQVAALEHLYYAMRSMATTDELSATYNRYGFESAGERLLRHLCRDRCYALLLYVDLDHLKHTNDSLGHGAGDRLLAMTGKLLRSACGESAIIGRIGGDEFAVLVRHNHAEDHTVLRQRLTRVIADHNAAGHNPQLCVSVGVVEFDPLRPESVHVLVERAERTMHAEKTSRLQAAVAMPRLVLAAVGSE